MKLISYLHLAAMLILSSSQAKDSQTIKIGLAGDVMIGRTVNDLLSTKPSHNLWGTMLPELKKQNVVIVNLETAITKHDKAVPKVFNFKTDPKNVTVLKQANIGIVSNANNHILDYNQQGLRDTLKTLDKAKIAHVGAGKNTEQARKPYFFKINNTRFAILGATDNEPTWVAGPNKPGTNYIEVGDKQFLEDIKKAKKQVDILIVTLHWGPNMKEYPSQKFINYAHKMIKSGADVVAGHSAHVMQGIEIFEKKLIIYDMGDFIDDYAITQELRNDLSALFSIVIKNKKVVDLNITPARISNMVVNKANKKDAELIFELLTKRSKQFKTTFYKQNSGQLYLALNKAYKNVCNTN